MNSHQSPSKWRYVAALFSGAALALAFAPVHLFGLSIVSPAALLLLCQNSSLKRVTLLTFTYGLGFFGLGASWIFNSIFVFGNTGFILAFTITAVFVIVLALFFAVQGYLWQKLFPKASYLKMLIGFPSLWVIMEWIRSWILSGFPWLLLGHSAVPSPLSGMAPIVGVYGLSFILVLLAGLLSIAAIPQLVEKPKGKIRWKHSNLAGLALLLIFGLCALSKHLHWTQSQPASIQASIVQGNVPQNMRWDPSQIQAIIDRYRQLSQQSWAADWVVWPEAAIPLTLQQGQAVYDELNRQSLRAHSTLLLGLPMQINHEYFNAAMMLGNNHGVYYKRHLVPFGEYVPLENQLRGLIGFFDLPMSSFVAGKTKQDLLTVKGVPIGVFICYEIAYNALLRNDVPQAEVLVTLSDDDWFGRSFAPWQHLQIAQFQAAASSRPLLFASNSGSSAFIDRYGHIEASLAPYIASSLIYTVQPETGTTPWVWLGDAPIVGFAFLLLLGAYWKGRASV